MCAAPSSLSRSLALPADEQGRHGEVAAPPPRAAPGGPCAPTACRRCRRRGSSEGHEPRVPVPVPPAVVAQAEVLGQARQVLGPRPVWVVGGDGVGRRLEVGEAVEALAHERPDAGHALRPRRAGRRRRARAPRRSASSALADGEQAGHPAERGADERRTRRATTRRSRGRRRRSARGCRSPSGDQSLSPWPRRSTVSAYQPAAPSWRAVLPHAWRVWPPPWSRTTGGSSGSPKASAASVTSSAAAMRMRPTLPSRVPEREPARPQSGDGGTAVAAAVGGVRAQPRLPARQRGSRAQPATAAAPRRLVLPLP